MLPESFLSVLNARPFPPQPRFDETRELTLADLLTTEEQDARDSENLAAVRNWLRDAYLTT